MIDVKPFTDKLDKLGEYMNLRIDGFGKVFKINLDAIPKPKTVKEILDLYFQTGWLFGTNMYNGNYEPPKEITFEEWLKLNTNNTKNI